MSKQFSIKGMIEFLGVDKAVTEIKKLDSSVQAMKKNSAQIGKGASQAAGGMQTIALGSAAVGAGFGLAIKEAADFEQAMANINSVNDLTKQQFQALRNEALHLGSSTTFSAKEAAEGMFELTKAGLTVEQTLKAIPGVLAAAATEGLQLGQASEIVVGILQGQNLEMDKASMVADVLAKTANATSAGMVDLGEAFKYANQLASAGLMTFDDTAASLGILANAGLKGSVAGTSMVAMFNQITKPSKDVQKAFGGMDKMMALFTDKATGKMKDLPQLIDIIGQAADGQSNDFMKMAFLTDFVGVEGAKAFSALRRAVTAKDAQGRPMFQGLRQDIQNSAGAAKEMADKRLDTLSGSFTMLHHELSAVSIAIGSLFIPELRSAADSAVAFARKTAKIFIAFGKAKEDLTAEDLNYMNSPLGQFIKGFIDGIKEAIGIFKETFASIRTTLAAYGIGAAGAEAETGRMIGKFLLLFAAVAPLVGGLLLVTMSVGAVVNTFMGLGTMLIGTGKLFWNLSSISIKAIQMMSGAIFSLAKGFVFLATNPIGLVILGIVALVAIGWFMYQNWGNIWGATKDLFMNSINYLIGTFQYLVDWFKTSSIGEIIAKTLLLPIRLALTPIMEIIQSLMNMNWAKNLFGADTANMIKKVASTLSILPDTDDINKMKVGGAQATGAPALLATPMSAQLPNTAAQVNAESVMASGRTVQAPSASEPANVNVTQAPIFLQLENITKLDGREINRSVSKQQIENSERAGMSSTNPKTRQMMTTNGGSAAGFSR